MAGTYTFGSRHAPPIVTYGVAPKRLQTVQPDHDDTGRRIAFSIAGVVAPVAAITLGVMAFSTSSDIPQKSPADRTENRSGYITLPAPEPIDESAASTFEAAPVPVVTPSQRNETAGFTKAPPAPTLAVDPVRQSWQPATAETQPVSVEIRAQPTDFAARMDMAEEPAVAPEIVEDILTPLKLASMPEKRPVAKELLANDPIEALEPLELRPEDEIQIVLAPTQVAQGTGETIRRDYSRTLATNGPSRDIPIEEVARPQPQSQPQLAINAFQPDPGAVSQIRDKIGAVKKAPLPSLALKNSVEADKAGLAAEKQDGISGIVAGADISTEAGSVTSVSLGAVLDMVQGQLDPSDYAAFAGSSHTQGHVSAAQLQNAGIGIDYDAGSGMLALYAIG